MSSDIALLGRLEQRRGRARVARGQCPRWTLAGLLLLACACGGSERSQGAPLPSEPVDAGPFASASPPADGASPESDAGTGAPSSGELFPSGDLPLTPDDPAPANGPAASDDPPASIDPELACSSGQARVICHDTENILLCVSGSPIESTCTALCDSYGRNTGPCNDGCQCGEPSNPTCVRASEDFCACTALTGAEPCTPDELDRTSMDSVASSWPVLHGSRQRPRYQPRRGAPCQLPVPLPLDRATSEAQDSGSAGRRFSAGRLHSHR
jgi:hypothetical protein